MLEVPNGISKEKVVHSILEKPHERGEGGGKVGNEGRLVELEDGLGWFLLKPERLRELEAGPVEAWTAFGAMDTGVVRAEVGGAFGQVGIDHGDHLRFPARRWPVTMSTSNNG